MKKLMIIAAVCAMASVAQAYAVQWSASNVRIPVATDPTKSQSGITTSSASDQFAAGALALSLFWIDQNGTENSILSKSNDQAGKLNTVNVIESGDDLYKAIVADFTSSGADNVTFLMRASYSTKDGVYDFSLTKDLATSKITGLDTSNASLLMNMNNGSWNYTANAVPEPTSGLLLLLGVAGLALRRRRA